ncbi:MAG: hypothetical protein R3B98_00340 [Hyphomonas sp.]
MIHTVPGPYPGVFRRVYPGFVQLASFMNMNWSRHVDAQWRFFNHLVDGDGDNAGKHREFMTNTCRCWTSRKSSTCRPSCASSKSTISPAARSTATRKIKPSAIRDVALMTVEGEKDDISGIGQTQAAHDLCTHLFREEMRQDYIQPGVGHYGVFNGNRFRTEIAPARDGIHPPFHETRCG